MMFANTVHVFSQRNNEMPSVAATRIRVPGHADMFFFFGNGTTLSADTGELIVVHRSIVVLEQVGLGGLLGTMCILPGHLSEEGSPGTKVKRGVRLQVHSSADIWDTSLVPFTEFMSSPCRKIRKVIFGWHS